MHSTQKFWFGGAVKKRCLGAALLWLILCPLLAAQETPAWTLIVQSENPNEDFVSSPSMAKLPNGNLVVSHIWRGSRFPGPTTDIQLSEDGGQTWARIARLENMLWGELVPIDEKLFLIGVDRRFGAITIRSSSDGGKTWTTPDETSGTLTSQVGYHTFGSSSLIYNGRIWKCVDRWSRKRFQSFLISAPITSDLLDPQVWTRSNAIGIEKNSLGGIDDRILEGSVVAFEDQIKVVLRASSFPIGGRACLAELTKEGDQQSLSISKTIAFPGGVNSFMVRYDEQTKKFWAVVTPESDPIARCNRLAISSSDNLSDWEVNYVPFYHVDSTWHGFLAPCFCIDGDDLLIVSDCAWGGTPSWIKPDKLIFKRVEKFRDLKISDSPLPTGRGDQPFRYEDAQLVIEGDGFKIADFKNGESAFFNFGQFKWRDIPATFDGWRFTKMPAGRKAEFRVTAKQNMRMYIAIAEHHRGPDITGWTATDDTFEYIANDETPPKMRVFARDFKGNEDLMIPQSSWSGTLLLIPPETP